MFLAITCLMLHVLLGADAGKPRKKVRFIRSSTYAHNCPIYSNLLFIRCLLCSLMVTKIGLFFVKNYIDFTESSYVNLLHGVNNKSGYCKYSSFVGLYVLLLNLTYRNFCFLRKKFFYSSFLLYNAVLDTYCVFVLCMHLCNCFVWV